MKITNIVYEASTISTPAFLDIFFEDGTKKTFQGKKAKKIFVKYEDLVGSEYDPKDSE